MSKQPSIVHLEKRVLDWAKTQQVIRAILVVGSLARDDHPGDEWADLDLIIFTGRSDAYMNGHQWLAEIGDVWVVVPHQIGPDEPELLVLFEGGYKVDFAFFTLDVLRGMVDAQLLDIVLGRGYYILLDKDGLASQLPPPSGRPPPFVVPAEGQFILSVNTFWYGAVYVAKQIRRRDMWIVKYRDWTMKQQLLQMMEWHAHATNGQSYDTWHDGRFLLEWVDDETRHQLQDTFGRFNAADSWRALLGSMALYRRLSREAAAIWGHAYPDTLDDRATQFVEALYAQEDGD